jgi:hypothetical protein
LLDLACLQRLETWAEALAKYGPNKEYKNTGKKWQRIAAKFNKRRKKSAEKPVKKANKNKNEIGTLTNAQKKELITTLTGEILGTSGMIPAILSSLVWCPPHTKEVAELESLVGEVCKLEGAAPLYTEIEFDNRGRSFKEGMVTNVEIGEIKSSRDASSSARIQAAVKLALLSWCQRYLDKRTSFYGVGYAFVPSDSKHIGLLEEPQNMVVKNIQLPEKVTIKTVVYCV